MTKLEDLKPQEVFHYFVEISNIPRETFNSKGIVDYLEGFAKDHGLKFERDQYDNIVIYKDATKGYESYAPVILQGHSDMVAVKTQESKHDFSKDGLKLKVEGDFLTAEETTLGADNGIAVAYMLAILADDKLAHPALEMVITANEEVGLIGATQFEVSPLKGKRLINLDSEEEGEILTACAGGATLKCVLPALYQEKTNTCLEITIDGLVGGHSGSEIDKKRANVHVCMGRLLYTLSTSLKYSLAKISGGGKENVIASQTTVEILVDNADVAKVEAIAKTTMNELRQEYAVSDSGINIKVENHGEDTKNVLCPIDNEKLILFLQNFPYGVQKMSGTIEGLVETSANIGNVKSTPSGVEIGCSVRSLVVSAKMSIVDRVQHLVEFLGGKFELSGEYPAWEFNEKSPLRQHMMEVYKEMYGHEMKVSAIHAGLECGIFCGKIEGLDCVSIGPDTYDVHGVNERISISSTERTWEYLKKVLESMH